MATPSADTGVDLAVSKCAHLNSVCSASHGVFDDVL